MSFRSWEANAAQLRAELGLEDAIVHPKILASRYELDVRGGGRHSSCIAGGRIVVDASAGPEQQAFDLAHELGHFALGRYNDEQSERGASYIAGALLLPRRPMRVALVKFGWDLEQLRRHFLHASPEVIARRVADVTEAVVTITDGRRTLARVASPWLPPPRTGLTTIERDVLRRAVESRRRVDEGWISATPFLAERERRVIVLAEFEQLSMRF
jgi:hypothetical protein